MKIGFAVLLVGLACIAGSSDAMAGSVLDQSFDPVDLTAQLFVGSGNLLDVAQTFTVGLTGTLTEVEVMILRGSSVTDPLLFDIRRTTSSGLPVASDSGSDILASVSVAASSVPTTPGFFSIGSLNAAVTSGDVLAIVLRSDAASGSAYGWRGAASGTYSDGGAYLRIGSGDWFNQGTNDYRDWDLAFKTYVSTVPLPPAGWLGLGLLGLLGAARRRRRK